MKTYLKITPQMKIIPYLGIIIGLLGLLVLLTSSNVDPCQIANGNLMAISGQTQKAIKTRSLEMAKYHTFKALNNLIKTKASLMDCGCTPILDSSKGTQEHLKNAARSPSLVTAKEYLTDAQGDLTGMLNVLDRFREEHTKDRDLAMLDNEELNRIDLELNNGLPQPHEGLHERMNQSLEQFETSLEAVLIQVDCNEAFTFITGIVGKSNRNLDRITLTDAQRRYHSAVKTIAYNALLKLNGCP